MARACDRCNSSFGAEVIFNTGTGTIECPSCRGNGKWDNGKTCSRCGGSGKIDCPKCHGTGQLGR